MFELMVFEYSGREMRTVFDKQGNPWWVLKDVCDVLGISKSRDVFNKLDSDQKGVVQIDTLGGRQKLQSVNESGLYETIFQSNKPEAKPFRKWVTSEVLPSIRKKGYYFSSEQRRLIEAYVSPIFLPWAKKFPNEFFIQIYKLRGMSGNPLSSTRPQFIGGIINNIIYDYLPDGVLEILQEQNPYDPVLNGRRKKHHQLLTPEIGLPHLEKQLIMIVGLMKASVNWKMFKRLLDRACPKPGGQLMLNLDMEI
ncbi:MAG: hypothetical protein HQK59_01700 [Deltaproteobacteria bacterium]|nr:hypothetical protein [Deltaproteobacteria bacterium]